MNLQSLKMHMIILMQNDLEAAITFYQKLGLPLKFHVEEKWAEFDIKGIKLGLAYIDAELPERRTGIVLEVDDARSWYAALREQGVEFVSEPVEAVHGIMVSIKDPGNNILDLYQPTPEKVQQMMQEMEREASCCGGKEECQCGGEGSCSCK